MEDDRKTEAPVETGESTDERLFGDVFERPDAIDAVDEGDAATQDEEQCLWSRIPKHGLAGFAWRLLLYGVTFSAGYLLLESIEEALVGVLVAVSAEAGHFALVGYLRPPRRRRLPKKIDAHELLGVKSPEDLSEKRRGGVRGRLNRARIFSGTFGVLGVVIAVLPFGLSGAGLGLEQLPVPEGVADGLGQAVSIFMPALFGFAAGFWPNGEKERVKELLQEEGEQGDRGQT